MSRQPRMTFQIPEETQRVARPFPGARSVYKLPMRWGRSMKMNRLRFSFLGVDNRPRPLDS